MHIGMWRRRLSLLVANNDEKWTNTYFDNYKCRVVGSPGMLHAYQDLFITNEVVSSAVSQLIFVRFSVIKWRV